MLLITGAAVGNRFGRRRTFAAGLGVFTLASVVCALAPDTGTLIVARTVQGAGSALVMPAAVALLAGAFPAERRGAALGVFTALTGLAVVGGPVVGGAVTEGLAWQWIFWLNVPIGAVLVPLGYAKITESRGPRTRPDLAGLVLVSAGLFGIVWGLVRSSTAGWASAEVVGDAGGRRRAHGRVRGLGGQGDRSRWCRCGCSPTGRSRRRTPRSSCSPRACSARCSSSPSTCR